MLLVANGALPKMQKKILLLGVLFLLVVPLIHSGILIKEKPNQQQVIVPRFMQTNVVYKIDKIYPIENYNDTCFKTLIADKSKIANSISLSAEDITMLNKGKLPYYNKGIKLEIDYTKENIICHNLINGIYKWGFNSSQVEVVDVDTGVYNNTHSNTTAINVTLGVNGTYTSEVYAINGSRNTTNLTLNTKSLGDVLVEGTVRISSIFDNITTKAVAYYDFNTFNFGDTSIHENTGIWETLVPMQFVTDNGRYIQTSEARFEGGIEGTYVNPSSNVHSLRAITRGQIDSFLSNATDGLTMCIFMNISNVTNQNAMFFAGSGFSLHTASGNTTGYATQGNCRNSTSGQSFPLAGFVFRTNIWTFHCLTRNETHCIHTAFDEDFPTGKVTTGTIIGDIAHNNKRFTIFGDAFTTDNFGKGDDFIIINESLGVEKLKQLYEYLINIDYVELPYQSFSNGVDFKNYTHKNMSRANFAQWKVKMFSNTTDTTILYQDGTNITFWNQSLGGEAPPEFTSCQDGHTTNCTFPNSFSLDKEINLTCLCNISEVSWARNISFVGTGEINVSTTISFYNISPLTDGSIGWISTNGFMNQTH